MNQSLSTLLVSQGWGLERSEQFVRLYEQEGLEHLPDAGLVQGISELLPIFRRQSDYIEDYFFIHTLEPLVATVAALSRERPELAKKVVREMDTWLLIPPTISAHGGWYRYQGRDTPPTYLDERSASTLEGAIGELEQGRKHVERLLIDVDSFYDEPFMDLIIPRVVLVVLHRPQEERLRGKKLVDEYALRRVYGFTCLLHELRDLHAEVTQSRYAPSEQDAFYDLLTNQRSLRSFDSVKRLSMMRMMIECREVDTLEQVVTLAWKKSQDPSFDIFVENLKLQGKPARVVPIDNEDAIATFLRTIEKSDDFMHVALSRDGKVYTLPDLFSPLHPGYELRRSMEQHIEGTLAEEDIIIGRGYHIDERLKTPAGVFFKLLSTKRLLFEERGENDKIDDTFGFRLLTLSEEACYRIQRALCDSYEVLTLAGGAKVNDYIKEPKLNNYRSLDFYIRILGQPVHLQVRTHEMNRANEYGSARHHDMKSNQMDNFQKKLRKDPLATVSFFKNLALSLIKGYECAQQRHLPSYTYQQILEMYRG